jgi:colanic acid/amylovoran biosynthesis glycosyltransferase
MKIAFLIGYFPALSETFILNQITGLLDRGHEVDIFAAARKGESLVQPEVLEYNLLSKTHYRYNPKDIFPALPGIFSGNFKKLPGTLNFLKYGANAFRLRLFLDGLHLLKNGPYDVVHSHFATKNIIGAELKEIDILKGKLVSTFYGYDITGFIKKNGKDVYDVLFRKADLIIVIVEKWKKKLIELGCKAEKIVVQRIGVNPEKFHNEFKGKNSNIRILSIGRFVEKKGFECGIRAFAKVGKKFPDTIYEIIGDGPLKNRLKILAEKLGIKEKVKFLGPKKQNEVTGIIKKSDIFLSPSMTAESGDEEGTPVVLMEAMASGLPVVSTNHGGIPELVKDGTTGFLVGEKDSGALADKLEILIKNPALGKKFGERGRKQIKENFNSNKLNDNLAQIYEKLLEGSKVK